MGGKPTHVSTTFANPFLRCWECDARAWGFHDSDRCGCAGGFWVMPCAHVADIYDVCPSWGPVDGCTCTPPHL